MTRAPIIMALAAAGLATSAASAGPQPISVDERWTRMSETSWRITPDGSIRYTTPDRPLNVPGPLPVPRQTRETGPAPARYLWIEGLLAPARRFAGRPLHCKPGLTDQSYGEVRWGDRVPSLRYDLGCMGGRSGKLIDRIKRADQQIALWAGAAPLVSTDKPQKAE